MEAHPNIKKIRLIDSPYECLAVKYINGKKSIAGGYMNGSVILFDVKHHKKELILADNDTNSINNAVTCIVQDHKNPNLLTCTYSGGVIKIWNYSSGYCTTIKEKRQTYGAVYHPKRQKMFTFGDDGKINLYDVETQTKEFVYQKSERMILDGHVSKIFSLRFNPVCLNEFLTAGWDSTLYFWDVRSQSAVRHISDIFMGGDGIVINKDGSEVVTCEWRKEDQLKIWDYKTGKLIKILQPDTYSCHLYCGRFLDDKIIGIGGSDSNMFRLVNLKTQLTASFVRGLNSGVTSMDVMMDTSKRSSIGKFDECSDLPMVTFSSGKTIYELRYRCFQ